MPSSITPNQNNYYKPKYEFDGIATQIKNNIISEVTARTKAKLLSTAMDLIQSLKKVNVKKETEYEFSNTNTSSLLSGVEHIVNLTFLPTPYINQFGERDETPELKLEICSISISLSKTEIRTELINQTGTIKEIVSQPDKAVNISGVLLGTFLPPTVTNPMAGMPVEDMKNLIAIRESKISVKVVSDYLNQFGIERLSINNLSMGQELEWKNIQRFTLSALSDDENLIIN